MKKRLILLVLVMMMLLGGCGGAVSSTAESQDSAPQSTETLRVYYTDAYSMTAVLTQFRKDNPDVTIDAVRFDTLTEMQEQIVKELNTNTGPDVVVFHYFNPFDIVTLDLEKMAHSGAFVPLDEYMQNDPGFDPENYLASAMDGAKVDGKQYYFPFSFRYITSFQDEAFGITPGETTLQEYFDWVQNESTPDVLNWVAPYDFPDFQLMLELLLASSNAGIVEITSGDVVTDLVALAWLVETAKTVWHEIDTFQQMQKENSSERIRTAALASAISLYNMSMDLHSSTPYFSELYGVQVNAFVLPTLQKPTEYAGLINVFGAVSKDSDNPALAYSFVKTMADFVSTDGYNAYNQVNRKNFYSWIEKYRSLTEIIGGVTMPGLSDEEVALIENTYENTTACHLPRPKITALIAQEFAPYFNGDASYETCQETFLRKATLYAQE